MNTRVKLPRGRRVVVVSKAGDTPAVKPSQLVDETGSAVEYLKVGDSAYDVQNINGVPVDQIITEGGTLTEKVTSQIFEAVQFEVRKNLVPDSDLKYGALYWALSGLSIAAAAGQVGGNGFIFAGTGAASGTKTALSQVIAVASGSTYTLSGYVDATYCSVNAPQWELWDPAVTTLYGSAAGVLGANGRVTFEWTVPGGVTQVVIRANSNNATITNAKNLVMNDPQLELGQGMTAYRSDAVTYGALRPGGIDTGQIDLSLSAQDAGSGGETVINNDTQYALDGAALGQTADATLTSNLPLTVAAAIALGMLTDAQASIGVGAAVRNALFSDGGFPYWADMFSGVVDGGVMGGTNFLNADTALTGSMATYGNKWVIPNIFPGAITVLAFAQANVFVGSGGTGAGANAGSVQLQISFDGGSTWNTSAQLGSTRIPDVSHTYPVGFCLHSVSGVPTGTIQIRLQAARTAGADAMTLQAGTSALGYVVLNSSNGIIAGNTNLAASLPGTSSMSCSSTYPSNSCTATKSLTVTANGGLPPYTFSNVKISGTGTLTAGASAQTFTVSDTETTTTGGATHNTTVQSTVTDTQTYTMAVGATEAGSTVTGTLTASALMAVGTLFDMASALPAGYNGTGLAALSGTTGTTLKYTAGTSGMAASTHTGTISNVRVVTSTCVLTGTFTLNYSAVSVSISSSGGACISIPIPDGGTGSCTATVTFTTNASGGDGSYSYANVKVSGGGTITSGASSKTWKAQESGSNNWSDSGIYKSTVTDGHSNSGNKSKTVNFSGST